MLTSRPTNHDSGAAQYSLIAKPLSQWPGVSALGGGAGDRLPDDWLTVPVELAPPLDEPALDGPALSGGNPAPPLGLLDASA